MVKIRLQRAGATKRPFYRIVAIDERRQRDGRALEFLGTYDPKRSPAEIVIEPEKIEAWVKKGAVLSETVRSLLGPGRVQAQKRAAERAARAAERARAKAAQAAATAAAGEGAA
jgi:small subunit ribosomal protein S16